MDAIDLANSALASKAPELIALVILVLTGITSTGILFRFVMNKFSSTMGDLQQSNEKNQNHLATTIKDLTATSHRFHETLMATTNKVLMDNTVQMARNTDVLERVMEKLA